MDKSSLIQESQDETEFESAMNKSYIDPTVERLKFRKKDVKDDKSFIDLEDYESNKTGYQLHGGNLFNRTFNRGANGNFLDSTNRQTDMREEDDGTGIGDTPSRRNDHTPQRSMIVSNNLNLGNIVGLENSRFDCFMNASLQ
jgi:hypothetical protein